MSDEDEELRKQIETMKRLGVTFDNPAVDPENVPAFAKTARVIGVVTVAVFILWGLAYDWTSYRGPFEQLLSELGMRGDSRDVGAYILAAGIGAAGWYYRFHVGVLLTTAFFWLAGLVGKFFKSV
jgi:hypothetical protein